MKVKRSLFEVTILFLKLDHVTVGSDHPQVTLSIQCTDIYAGSQCRSRRTEPMHKPFCFVMPLWTPITLIFGLVLLIRTYVDTFWSYWEVL